MSLNRSSKEQPTSLPENLQENMEPKKGEEMSGRQAMSGRQVLTWSMAMGFWTLNMLMCWKTTFLTNPLLGLAHDLILTPFCVPIKVTVLTVTFWTPSSSRSFARLPMLHQCTTFNLEKKKIK